MENTTTPLPELNAKQIAVLQSYRLYRTQPPTFTSLTKLWFRTNAIRLLVAFFLIWTQLQSSASSRYSMLAIGFLWGSIFRSFFTSRQFVTVWPALAAVLDWNRVDQILATVRVQKRSQFRLSSAVVMMVCAGILVGLNATGRTVTQSTPAYTASWIAYGFPYPFIQKGASLTYDSTAIGLLQNSSEAQQAFLNNLNWDHYNLCFDIFVLVMAVILARRISETIARKREQQRLKPPTSVTPPSAPPPPQTS